jgi:hypothetical protein
MLFTDGVTNALEERKAVTLTTVLQHRTASGKDKVRRHRLSLGRININLR